MSESTHPLYSYRRTDLRATLKQEGGEAERVHYTMGVKWWFDLYVVTLISKNWRCEGTNVEASEARVPVGRERYDNVPV